MSGDKMGDENNKTLQPSWWVFLVLLFSALVVTTVMFHVALTSSAGATTSWAVNLLGIYIFLGVAGVASIIATVVAFRNLNSDSTGDNSKQRVVLVGQLWQLVIVVGAFLTTLFLNFHLQWPGNLVWYELYLWFGLGTVVLFLAAMSMLSFLTALRTTHDTNYVYQYAPLTQFQCAGLCTQRADDVDDVDDGGDGGRRLKCSRELIRSWVGFCAVLVVVVTFVLAIVDATAHDDELTALQINTPIIVALGLLLVFALMFLCTLSDAIRKAKSDDDGEDKTRKPNSWELGAKVFSFVVLACFASFALVAVILTSVKLDNPDAVSWNVVFSFIYLTFGLPLVFLLVGLMLMKFTNPGQQAAAAHSATTALFLRLSNADPSFVPMTVSLRKAYDERKD
jgi:hypothetical protein